MAARHLCLLLAFGILSSCGGHAGDDRSGHERSAAEHEYSCAPVPPPRNGALLLTQFESLDQLKEVVDIEYVRFLGKPAVMITHRSGDGEVVCKLSRGVDQAMLYKAQKRGIWYRLGIVLRSPKLFFIRKDLVRVELLARWRANMFGERDLAFFDIAQKMVYNIHDTDMDNIRPEDLSEKGYLNTFNHVTAQALITTLFSEDLAALISDLHERFAMPELITGQFTEAQLADLETGPLDNYLDIVNNEWGQELGLHLKAKYCITRNTRWTPELLASYLNDVQDYYSWTFGIAFTPFRPSDRMVTHYTEKMNDVLFEFESVTKGYY